MTGTVGILNVGAGDVELNFDKSNPAERIRAARIVKDMLRRGYALMVEVERDGEKRFERAVDFDEAHAKYLIADFDPLTAEETDAWEQAARQRRADEKAYGEESTRHHGEEATEAPQPATGTGESTGETGGEPGEKPRKRGRPRREVDAGSTRAVAVGRSAGG